jgi:hypothetical protein
MELAKWIRMADGGLWKSPADVKRTFGVRVNVADAGSGIAISSLMRESGLCLREVYSQGAAAFTISSGGSPYHLRWKLTRPIAASFL